MTLRTVKNYEGKNLFPKNQDVVKKLCKGLDTTPDYLISDDRFVNAAYERGGTRDRRYSEKLISEVSAFFADGEVTEEDHDIVLKCVQVI